MFQAGIGSRSLRISHAVHLIFLWMYNLHSMVSIDFLVFSQVLQVIKRLHTVRACECFYSQVLTINMAIHVRFVDKALWTICAVISLVSIHRSKRSFVRCKSLWRETKYVKWLLSPCALFSFSDWTGWWRLN